MTLYGPDRQLKIIRQGAAHDITEALDHKSLQVLGPNPVSWGSSRSWRALGAIYEDFSVVEKTRSLVIVVDSPLSREAPRVEWFNFSSCGRIARGFSIIRNTSDDYWTAACWWRLTTPTSSIQDSHRRVCCTTSLGAPRDFHAGFQSFYSSF